MQNSEKELFFFQVNNIGKASPRKHSLLCIVMVPQCGSLVGVVIVQTFPSKVTAIKYLGN